MSAAEQVHELIREPGVYDIAESAYHADPVDGGSLSSTEARLLLESPARYRYRKDHGEEHRQTFDFGRAAHRAVLGVGRPVTIIDAADYRKADAREQRDNARASGVTPLLASEVVVIEAMYAALRDHPLATALMRPDSGKPEQTIVWRDARTGVMCRALLDWLPDPVEGQRLILADFKTTIDASSGEFGRTAAKYGYHQQAAWYIDGVTALFDVPAALVFIAQEKHPPYLVNVIELDAYALTIGRERNARAVDLYVACCESGEWPGYGPDVEQAHLPRWAEVAHEQETTTDD